MSETLKLLKKDARLKAGLLRAGADGRARDEASLALLLHGFPVRPESGCKVVSAFYPYQEEIDTRPLLTKLAGEGWTTCLPIVIAPRMPLEFRRWFPGEPTIAGQWDIPRPADDAPVVEPDVLLVPMLAFDRMGYRLGYGGGFYDRTLAKLRAKKPVIAIGVAFAAQEVSEVPHDGLDQRMDYVMTERDLIACG